MTDPIKRQTVPETNPANAHPGANGAVLTPIPPGTTADLIAAALPDLLAHDTAERRQLQRALLDCRSGGPAAPRDRQLRAAFQLYEEELLSRGDICALLDLDVRQFIDLLAQFSPDADRE